MAIIDAIPEVPQQQSAIIRNKGSFTIPEVARQAHRMVVDIEIQSVTRNQYFNLQYNMPQGDYCNVTYWHGKAIAETRKVKYPVERLIDWVNLEASLLIFAANNVLVTNINMKTIATAQGILLGETDFIRPASWAHPCSHLKFVAPPDTQFKVTCTWWPFELPPLPIAAPEPNTAQPPGGGDEYKSPQRNPNDDPWDGNAPPTGPDPNRDPRDYGPDNEPPPPPSPGPDCTKMYYISWSVTATNEQGGSATTEGVSGIQGEITGFDTYFNPAFGSWAYRAIRKSCEGQIEYVNMFGTTGAQSISGSVSSVVEA